MNNYFQPFWGRLETDGDVDHKIKLEFIDVLKQNHDFLTAATLQWCIDNKRWPKKVTSSWATIQTYWYWTGGVTANPPKKVTSHVPKPLLEESRRYWQEDDKWHPTVSFDRNSLPGAIYSLTAAFRRLKSLLPPGI